MGQRRKKKQNKKERKHRDVENQTRNARWKEEEEKEGQIGRRIGK